MAELQAIEEIMKETMEKYIRRNYPNLGKVKSIKMMEHDNINSTNFLVITSKGKYVLRNFTDGSKPKGVRDGKLAIWKYFYEPKDKEDKVLSLRKIVSPIT